MTRQAAQLQFPGNLSNDEFLRRHWQKRPLPMPGALPDISPSLSRNDLAWLATHDDVESRIVFHEPASSRQRYRVEHGPFDEQFLTQLPRRNWTLLVHDVEKHLPAMRRLLRHVSFIPDWRIDDVMISFAAPGGGVGPHRDNYDVFLCQGIGVRHWSFSEQAIARDPDASSDLLLLEEFTDASDNDCRAGDVLYLPPDVAHWGVARRACMTYSIGMRAPLLSVAAQRMNLAMPSTERFYEDADLGEDEARPGRISTRATARLCRQLGVPVSPLAAQTLGQIATETKVWLTPEPPDSDTIQRVAATPRSVRLHGMARIAFDDAHVFVNGSCFALDVQQRSTIAELCEKRRWPRRIVARLAKSTRGAALFRHLASHAAFDLTNA